jgi:hypothetical protein
MADLNPGSLFEDTSRESIFVFDDLERFEAPSLSDSFPWRLVTGLEPVWDDERRQLCPIAIVGVVAASSAPLNIC